MRSLAAVFGPCPGAPMAARANRVRLGGGVAMAVAGLVLAGCGSPESAAPASSPPASGRPSVVVYRTPSCGCCKNYEDYLRKHGFGIQSEVVEDLELVRADNEVPSDAASCHTVLVDGYGVEGHVPVEAIEMMLEKRPDIDGISIPGMPTNAPGMGEPDGRPIEVVSFVDGSIEPFITL